MYIIFQTRRNKRIKNYSFDMKMKSIIFFTTINNIQRTLNENKEY